MALAPVEPFSKRQHANIAPLTEENYRLFPRIRAALARHGRAALDKLYGRIAADPQVAKLLPTQELRTHASNAQFRHWQELFTGRIDAASTARSEKIGRIHAHIGLTPAYYISSYALVLEEVIRAMMDNGWASLAPRRGMGKIVGTLIKTALHDMEAALSAYFATEELNRDLLTKELSKALAAMAEGDLRINMAELPAIYAPIGKDFHKMSYKVSVMVRQMTPQTIWPSAPNIRPRPLHAPPRSCAMSWLASPLPPIAPGWSMRPSERSMARRVRAARSSKTPWWRWTRSSIRQRPSPRSST